MDSLSLTQPTLHDGNAHVKTYFFVRYPALLVLGITKRQTKLPNLPRLVYPIPLLNIVSVNIFFPLGKMMGMVRLRTNFILSSWSWEIGSPPTGGAGRMKLSCVVPVSVILI